VMHAFEVHEHTYKIVNFFTFYIHFKHTKATLSNAIFLCSTELHSFLHNIRGTGLIIGEVMDSCRGDAQVRGNKIRS